MEYTLDPFKGFTPRQNPPRKSFPLAKGIYLAASEIGSHIPPHEVYKCPVERWFYKAGKGLVVAQGIVFDGGIECFLAYKRVNGGKRWVWVSNVPAYEIKELIWKR